MGLPKRGREKKKRERKDISKRVIVDMCVCVCVCGGGVIGFAGHYIDVFFFNVSISFCYLSVLVLRC